MKFLLAFLLVSNIVFAKGDDGGGSYSPPEESKTYSGVMEQSLKNGRLVEKTNEALTGIIKYAVFELKNRGFVNEAKELQNEFTSGQHLLSIRLGYGIGDHAPLLAFLAKWYDRIELSLGSEIMHMTRLVDLKVFNYAIPVILFCVDKVDTEEYGAHFIPFTGVLTYWTSLISCSTMTAGAWVLICSPVSYGAEWTIERFVAPGVSPFFHDLFCPNY